MPKTQTFGGDTAAPPPLPSFYHVRMSPPPPPYTLLAFYRVGVVQNSTGVKQPFENYT